MTISPHTPTAAFSSPKTKAASSGSRDCWSHGRRAELEPIVVARDRRGHGVGRSLADAVVSAARAAGTIRVFVRPTARNAEAIRFFHSCGFDLLGYAQLQVDFEDRERRPGVRLAGREFSV
jgi:GNAT superfamily N-acetyltransferase